MSSEVWSYRRGASPAIVEACEVEGRDVALPPHFHDDDQVTLVLAGRRRFVIEGAPVAVARGEIRILPAGTVHASLPEPAGGVCRNLYLPAGTIGASGFDAALALWRASEGRDDTVFAYLRAATGEAPACTPATPRIAVRPGETVARAASRARMSREGFSRAFSRQRGLPPRLFRQLARLNAARALLRAGEAPAAVAAAAGFADQSHLGREFRRVFGISPGRFRAGASQSFQIERRP